MNEQRRIAGASSGDSTTENSILSELKYGASDIIRSNATTPSPNLSMSESDLSNVLENNMRSIIESDNNNSSSSNNHHNHHNHYGSIGNSGNVSSTPINTGKQGSFFATFLGGYQNRGNSLLSPAFKSRSTVLSTPHNAHIGHTSSMHDFVPESGTKVIDYSVYFLCVLTCFKF